MAAPNSAKQRVPKSTMTPPAIQMTRTLHIEPTSRDMSLATRKTACPTMDPTTTAVAAHRPRPRTSSGGFAVSDLFMTIDSYREFGRVALVQAGSILRQDPGHGQTRR